MGEIEYRLTEVTESVVHRSYGICAVDPKTGETYAVKNRITKDRERLLELIRLCNDLKLSPVLLDDVIDDFLNDI